MDKKYCTNCGTENVSNASFCISCGSSFETKPVEENVVEETPIVNETPVVNTEVQTPSVTSEPPKKKKGKGCLIAIIVILLIAGLIVGGIFLYKKLTFFEDPFVDENSVSVESKTIIEKLDEDLSNGKIDKNQYVMQIAYELYEPALATYGDSSINTVDFYDLYNKVKEYSNDLSEDTLLYIYKKINLSDYSWPTSDEEAYETNNEANVYNATVKYMTDKPDGNVKHLNGVVLSSNGHFLVYYSTEGRYPTKKSQAKKVAKHLESTVDSYKSKYNLDFDFEIQYNNTGRITKPYSYNSVKKLLEENGIDVKYLDTAMPVYILDNDAEKTNHPGFYNPILEDWFLKTLAATGSNPRASAEENVNFTTYGFPYFVLSSSVIGTDDQNFVASHELFHHYQHYICGDGSYVYCTSSNYTIETTASEAALNAYKVSKPNTSFNHHSGLFSRNLYYSAKALSEGSLKQDYGYIAYVFGHNYENVVPNGANVMFQSMKTDNPLKYIYDNSNGKYSDALIETATKVLTLDYDNKALIPTSFEDDSILYPRNEYNLPGNKGLSVNTIESSSMRYFYIKTYNYPEKYQLRFKRDSYGTENLYLLFFIKDKDNDKSYKMVYKHKLDDEFVINIDDFKYYDELVFGIVNTYYDNVALYDFEIIDSELRKPTVTAKSLNLKEPKANKKKKNVITSKIVCSQVEDLDYIKSTYQVMVSFDNKDEVNDLYVKGTVEMEDNYAFKIAKGVTTGAVFLLKQKYKDQFGKITLRTYDEGNKYIILGRVNKDVDTAARNSFGTNDLTREGIFKAIEDKGFTCEYR